MDLLGGRTMKNCGEFFGGFYGIWWNPNILKNLLVSNTEFGAVLSLLK
jgi:hypothetical protein